MKISFGKCSVTGKNDRLVHPNNPLLAPIGLTHIYSLMDPQKLAEVEYVCRTMNFPFNPEEWIKAYNATPKTPLETYIEKYLILYTTPEFEGKNKNLWKQVDEEWQNVRTHADILTKIEPIKKDFMNRSAVKWGVGFSFLEYIKMEDQFTTTISSFDIQNPMQIDAIKKACITSVMIDKKMLSGEIKDIKDLTAAFAQFMKMAQIDEMIESQQSDVIRTVADLADYLEKSGFDPKYYDGFDRDQVDRTIKDLKEYLRNLVYESTGLEQTLELISKKYKEDLKANVFEENAALNPIEALVNAARDSNSDEVDKQSNDEYDEDSFGDYNEEDF